jgi:hypothetical protein
MSRADRGKSAGNARSGNASASAKESALVAEEIGDTALILAKAAHDAGLTSVAYLLESVALEAGAEAVARRWPEDLTGGSVSAKDGAGTSSTARRPHSPRSKTHRGPGGR